MVNKTKEEILAAIEGSAGVISQIARKLGVAWNTAQSIIERDEDTKTAYNNEKEKILDLAESKIIEAVNMGDIQTAKWYLGLIGRKRGYSEKIEIEHSGRVPVVVEFYTDGE